MKIFISGGCKNGKSFYALRLAARQASPCYYVATMTPSDNEDEDRIARHKAEREGYGFSTIELPKDIERLSEKCDNGGSFLLDSLTALLANEMFQGDKFYADAYKKGADGVLAITEKLPNIVIVSDYIYSDAFLYDEWTENYRRGLAFADRAAASACDAVLEVSFGGIIVHKDAKGFIKAHEADF